MGFPTFYPVFKCKCDLLGSGSNRGQSHVEWGDFPCICLSVPSQGYPTRPEAQPARPESQPARPETSPARPEAMPARPVAQAWLWCGWLGFKPGLPVAQAWLWCGWLVFRPGWLGFRPG